MNSRKSVLTVLMLVATCVITNPQINGMLLQIQDIIKEFNLSDTEPARGAALAVLNATNRILGNRLFMR